jgi:hypothetical protein
VPDTPSRLIRNVLPTLKELLVDQAREGGSAIAVALGAHWGFPVTLHTSELVGLQPSGSAAAAVMPFAYAVAPPA